MYKEGAMVKLAPNGHSSVKMLSPPPQNNNTNNNHNNEEQQSQWQSSLTENNNNTNNNNSTSSSSSPPKKPRVIGSNLFADSNVPSSFRRLSFSPDGLLLIAPTGVFRPPNSTTTTTTSSSSSSSSAATQFCTHLFLREHYETPAVSLSGLEDPSVAVRCCPRLFKPMKDSDSSSSSAGLFQGNYR
jgi:hypothetical protein